MRASGLQMLLALCRLPMIGWHLGRAGTLGHLARVSMLPIWMRRICRLADMMVRSRSARSDAGAALAEALIRLGLTRGDAACVVAAVDSLCLIGIVKVSRGDGGML